MKLKAHFSLITLISSLSVTIQSFAATLDWSIEDGGSNFNQGDAININGTVEVAGNSTVGDLPLSNTVTNLSNGITLTKTYTGSVGTGDNSSATSIFGGGAGFTSFTIDEDTQGGWGGIFATSIADRSAYVVQTSGGPIEQSNTANVFGVDIAFAAGGATNVSFDLAGLSSQIAGGLLNTDRLTITAFDSTGVPIALNTGVLTAPSGGASYFLTNPNANTARIIGDNNLANINDHTDVRTTLNVNFGSTAVGSINIQFDPIVNGTGNFTSAGFAISDIEFTNVPEPSSALLLGFAALCGLAHRKR